MARFIFNCIDKYVSKKTVIIRPRDKVFMNGVILKLIRQRNRSHNKAKRTNNPQTEKHTDT
jgi:hypothetical protein